MTEPVDTDALRALAAHHEEAQRFEDDVPIEVRDATSPALHVAADEVERLRAVIENAPHADSCMVHALIMYYRICNCWKADAL